MKLDVTRDVVSDLWPLCRSGDASADSRALVDAFLAGDVSFAASLQEAARLPGPTRGIRLSPDAESRLLEGARRQARMKLLVIGGAIALTGLVGLAALAGLLLLFFRSV